MSSAEIVEAVPRTPWSLTQTRPFSSIAELRFRDAISNIGDRTGCLSRAEKDLQKPSNVDSSSSSRFAKSCFVVSMARGSPTNALRIWLFLTCSCVCWSLISVDATQLASLAAVSSGSESLTTGQGMSPPLLEPKGERLRPLIQPQGTGRCRGQSLEQKATSVLLLI